MMNVLENPQHPSLQIKKMKGYENHWEGRVTLHYRFTFMIEGDRVRYAVAHWAVIPSERFLDLRKPPQPLFANMGAGLRRSRRNTGFWACPWRRISKCRWCVVARPVRPTAAIGVPASTRSPA